MDAPFQPILKITNPGTTQAKGKEFGNYMK